MPEYFPHRTNQGQDMPYTRQSRPDYGLSFQFKVVDIVQRVPFFWKRPLVSPHAVDPPCCRPAGPAGRPPPQMLFYSMIYLYLTTHAGSQLWWVQALSRYTVDVFAPHMHFFFYFFVTLKPRVE